MLLIANNYFILRSIDIQILKKTIVLALGYYVTNYYYLLYSLILLIISIYLEALYYKKAYYLRYIYLQFSTLYLKLKIEYVIDAYLLNYFIILSILEQLQRLISIIIRNIYQKLGYYITFFQKFLALVIVTLILLLQIILLLV